MKSKNRISNPAFKPMMMGLLVLFIGITLSLLYWRSARHADHARIRLLLEDDGKDIASRIYSSLDNAMHELASMESLYRSKTAATRKAFALFVEQYLTPDSGIQALGWNPRVSHVERQRFVEAVRDEGLTGFEITERNAAGKTIDAELQLKRKDGTVLDVNLNASAVRDQQGSVVQSRSVYRNSTRQKKAEKELKMLNEELEKRVAKRTESHARLAALVTSSSDAIIVADMDGNVTEWNQAAADLFGYPIDEVFGVNLEMLYPERIRHEREQIFNKLQRGETVQGYETVRPARGGREIDVLVTVSLVTTPEGEVIGMSAILRTLEI